MSQAVLFAALFLVGWPVAAAFGPVGRPALTAALAFPTGLAIAVFAAIVVLATGLPYAPWTIGLGWAPLAAPAVVALARRPPDRRTVVIALAWWAGLVAASLALSAANLTIMTYDSHQFVMMGRVLVDDGGAVAGTLTRLQSWGVFQVVAQSFAGFTRQDFLYALPPVFGISFVPLFALLLWHGARAIGATPGRARLLAALVAAALVTIYMFHRHVFYIHTNLAAAVYLCLFVALFWLAEVTRDPAGLPLAFVALLAFSLQRVETPVFALVFLVLTALDSELPHRVLRPLVIGYAVAVAGWYELLAANVPPDGDFLTPARCHLIAGGVVAFAAYFAASRHPRLEPLRRWPRRLLPPAVALVLAAAFVARPAHLAASAEHWARSLLTLPYWGESWFFIAGLVVLGLALPRPPHRGAFVHGIWITAAIVLLLSLARIPYRTSVHDSANRMTLHILPLIFFYLGLKLIPALARPRPAAGAPPA